MGRRFWCTGYYSYRSRCLVQPMSKDGLKPIGEIVKDALSGLPGPVQALQPSVQARRGFTQSDQVNQLAEASEADPDRGFMARLLSLCSLPRTNPGNQLQHIPGAVTRHAWGCAPGAGGLYPCLKTSFTTPGSDVISPTAIGTKLRPSHHPINILAGTGYLKNQRTTL